MIKPAKKTTAAAGVLFTLFATAPAAFADLGDSAFDIASIDPERPFGDLAPDVDRIVVELESLPLLYLNPNPVQRYLDRLTPWELTEQEQRCIVVVDHGARFEEDVVTFCREVVRLGEVARADPLEAES